MARTFLLRIPRLLTRFFLACTEEGRGTILEMFRRDTTATVHRENKAKAHAYRHACSHFLSDFPCKVFLTNGGVFGHQLLLTAGVEGEMTAGLQ